MKKTLMSALAGVFALSVATTALAQDKVTMVYGAPWNASDSYIPFGIQLGFFKDENLVVEPVSVAGAAVMVPQIAQGNVQFGMAPPEFLMMAAEKGEPFPVKAVLKVFSQQIFEYIVPADSPLKSIADLKDRKLGVGALGWGNLAMTRVQLKDAGLEWQKDVTPVPVGVGPAAWTMLKESKVDALNLFIHQNAMMEAAGYAVKRLPMPAKYDQLVGGGIVTSDKLIAENPQLVERFTRAITRSLIACNANPTGCAKAFWAFDPAAKPADEAKQAEWLKNYGLINARVQGMMHKFQKDGAFGMYEDKEVNELMKQMREGGQLGPREFSMNQILTNQFVKAANQFDLQATLKAAKAAGQ